MIRWIFWRLLFEACNITRLFGHGSQQVQYLAFGANLSSTVLKERRITPFAVKYFTLRDYGLRFDHPSRWVGYGYASAEQSPGESLHGFLYTLSGRDATRMDFYECVPVLKRYRRTFVEQDGVPLFFYQTNISTPNLRPTAEYLGYVVEGLESHPDASADYCKAIAATTTGNPGRLVKSYFWMQPESRAPWPGYAIDSYQHLALRFCLGFLYKRSLTVHLIRHSAK